MVKIGDVDIMESHHDVIEDFTSGFHQPLHRPVPLARYWKRVRSILNRVTSNGVYNLVSEGCDYALHDELKVLNEGALLTRTFRRTLNDVAYL
jgi:hypothetical protein